MRKKETHNCHTLETVEDFYDRDQLIAIRNAMLKLLRNFLFFVSFERNRKPNDTERRKRRVKIVLQLFRFYYTLV